MPQYEFEKAFAEGLVKGFIEAFLKLIPGFENKEKLKQEFKDYLYKLADNLSTIVSTLEKGDIPEGMGTEIKTSLKDFEKKIKRLRIGSSKKQEILTLHTRIQNSLRDGKFLDDYIAGNILRDVKPRERKQKLLEMKRTAGAIRGYANAL